jgi:hypothetical protein
MSDLANDRRFGGAGCPLIRHVRHCRGQPVGFCSSAGCFDASAKPPAAAPQGAQSNHRGGREYPRPRKSGDCAIAASA